MKSALHAFGDEARAAFAKVGVLMASARRTAQALHPTNLHVNASLFPRDTDAEPPARPRVARGLARPQIQFDRVWEGKVVERILHNLSLLMERSFASVQELNRFRKEVTAKLARPPPRSCRPRRAPPGLIRGRFVCGAGLRAFAISRACSALRSAATFCALGRSPTTRV
jgi:hypothetical protein